MGSRLAPTSSASCLLIGYGNTLRSDDGVGPRLAERVEALQLPGVTTLTCGLLTPELADPISRVDKVVFVDASLEPCAGVELRAINPAASSQVMAHAADPRSLLALSRDVFGRAPEAWWLTIPVENLTFGEQLSARAERGFADALQAIRKFVGGGSG